MTISERACVLVAAGVLLAATALATEPSVRSRPNALGGQDHVLPDGERLRGRPNVFGGEDITSPTGTIRSRPNALGGSDCVER